MEIRKLYWMQLLQAVIRLIEMSESSYASGRSNETNRYQNNLAFHSILMYLMRFWNIHWNDGTDGGYPVSHRLRERYVRIVRDAIRNSCDYNPEVGYGDEDSWLGTIPEFMELYRRILSLDSEGYVSIERLEDAIEHAYNAGMMTAV